MSLSTTTNCLSCMVTLLSLIQGKLERSALFMVILFSLLTQGKLERSALYAHQQAAIARAAATCIQAVWRGRMARQFAASQQVLQQQQQKLNTAAAAIQVGAAVQPPLHVTHHSLQPSAEPLKGRAVLLLAAAPINGCYEAL